MMNPWALSALWLGLALVAVLLAIWFKVATALSEIVVGTVAQLIIGATLGTGGSKGSGTKVGATGAFDAMGGCAGGSSAAGVGSQKVLGGASW